MKQTILRRTALSSAILFSLGSAQGAIILVGDGLTGCSLQDAILAANTDTAVNNCTAGSGDDILQLEQPNTSITVSSAFVAFQAGGLGQSGLPEIDSVMTIEGNGLTINADNSSENFRIFQLAPGSDLTLRDTTVSGADDGAGLGSGLFSLAGRVTLDNATFQNNNGAVFLAYSQDNVITNSVITNNTISNYYYAAGIQTYFAGLSLSNSSITNNKFEPGAAPIPAVGGPGRTPSGGGLMFYQSQVSVTNTTVSGNSGYLGGGIAIFGLAPPPPGTEGRFGLGRGGPVYNDISLINNTITNNKALVVGGLLNLAEAGTITMQGNILSGNRDMYSTFNNAYSDPYSTFNLDANNIIGDQGEPQVFGLTLGASDLTFTNATSDNLYPLIASNGQQVHPLRPGSVAIDGMPPSCFGLFTDQEGKGRGVDGNNDGSFICDIGALENAKPIFVNDAPCDLVNAVNSANADASVGGCQPGNGHDIIVLEENSLHSLDTANYALFGYYNFGLPAITSGVTLAGNASTIEKADSFVEPLDIAFISPGGDLTLSDVTLTKANSVAAVYATGGDVTLLNTTITGNQAIALATSGGVKSAVLNSTISNNNNLGTRFDGVGAGIVTFFHSNFSMQNSTISNNVSGQSTGFNVRYGFRVEVLNSTISGNTATTVGANVSPYASADGSAGGINLSQSRATLTGLTITNNVAEYLAAGLVVSGYSLEEVTQVQRSIISGNVGMLPPPKSPSIQPNVYAQPSRLPILNRRFGNQQNNMQNRGFLVDEVAVTGSPATIVVDASNVFGQNNDSGSLGFPVGMSDVIPAGATDTVIEPTLADNGGNTLTHNPVASGPAVDNAGVCEESVDQLGNFRSWDASSNSEQFGACDIGAVEYDSIPVDDIIFKDDFEDDGFM